MNHGAQTDADLCELWSRIVFNMLVSNTDDHLRNHGFMLVPGKGWRLSEAFDMNPVPHAQGLKLNVSEADNLLDLDPGMALRACCQGRGLGLTPPLPPAPHTTGTRSSPTDARPATRSSASPAA
jgi:hypothetical protein